MPNTGRWGGRRSVWIVLFAVLGACTKASTTPRTTPLPTVHRPGNPSQHIEPSFFAKPAASANGLAASEPAPEMRVHLIDVGQGAATLIEFSCAAILVDTGGEMDDEFDSNQHLMDYLDAFFRSRPDLHQTLALLLITHPHIDHARGAKSVWETYHVQNVVTDGLTTSSGGRQQAALIKAARDAGIGLEAINADDVPADGLTDATIDPVKCDDGDPDIRVLWGAVKRADVDWPQKRFDDANNHSVVTKVTLGKASLLITGDLEVEGIGALLQHYQGTQTLDADVYEVGHHGSNNGTTKELLDAITPKLALIAVGSKDRNPKTLWTAWQYGHPREVTIDLLAHALSGLPRAAITEPLATGAKKFTDEQITAPIYATAWDGNVIVSIFADGTYSVKTQNTH